MSALIENLDSWTNAVRIIDSLYDTKKDILIEQGLDQTLREYIDNCREIARGTDVCHIIDTLAWQDPPICVVVMALRSDNPAKVLNQQAKNAKARDVRRERRHKENEIKVRKRVKRVPLVYYSPSMMMSE